MRSVKTPANWQLLRNNDSFWFGEANSKPSNITHIVYEIIVIHLFSYIGWFLIQKLQ